MKNQIIVILLSLFLVNGNLTFSQTEVKTADSLQKDSIEQAKMLLRAKQLEIANLLQESEIQNLVIKEQEHKRKIHRLFLIISLLALMTFVGLFIRLVIQNRNLKKLLDSKNKS